MQGETIEHASCLLVILDGCREDYINEELTPFLNYLKSTGSYTKLDVSSSLYTPAEISTGNSPITTDTFFDFCFDPENSSFKFFRFVKLPINLRQGNAKREEIWRKVMSVAYSKITHNWVDFPPNIPFSLLQYFNINPSLIKFQKAEREGSKENLFGILKENGFSFQSISGYATSIMKKSRLELMERRHVLMLHYEELDKVGHQYGPNSAEVKNSLRHVDISIEEAYGAVSEQVDFIMVFGDHNMEEVKEHIDLWKGLKKLRAKIPKDYVVFLNTPVARFWFKNERAQKEVRSFLSSLNEYGREATKEELRERGFPSDKKYGELIFWLKKGVAIVPDFYHEYPIKGMHFYFDYTARTVFILSHKDNSIRIRREGKLRDVMPTVLDLLNINDSLNRDGKSLVITG